MSQNALLRECVELRILQVLQCWNTFSGWMMTVLRTPGVASLPQIAPQSLHELRGACAGQSCGGKGFKIHSLHGLRLRAMLAALAAWQIRGQGLPGFGAETGSVGLPGAKFMATSGASTAKMLSVVVKMTRRPISVPRYVTPPFSSV